MRASRLEFPRRPRRRRTRGIRKIWRARFAPCGKQSRRVRGHHRQIVLDVGDSRLEFRPSFRQLAITGSRHFASQNRSLAFYSQLQRRRPANSPRIPQTALQRRLDLRRPLDRKLRRERQPRGIKRRSRIRLVGGRGLIHVRIGPCLQRRHGQRSPPSRLRKPHEATPIATVGADEIRGLTCSAHESFGARDRSARVIHRAHRRIGHGPRRTLHAAQRS